MTEQSIPKDQAQDTPESSPESESVIQPGAIEAALAQGAIVIHGDPNNPTSADAVEADLNRINPGLHYKADEFPVRRQEEPFWFGSNYPAGDKAVGAFVVLKGTAILRVLDGNNAVEERVASGDVVLLKGSEEGQPKVWFGLDTEGSSEPLELLSVRSAAERVAQEYSRNDTMVGGVNAAHRRAIREAQMKESDKLRQRYDRILAQGQKGDGFSQRLSQSAKNLLHR